MKKECWIASGKGRKASGCINFYYVKIKNGMKIHIKGTYTSATNRKGGGEVTITLYNNLPSNSIGEALGRACLSTVHFWDAFASVREFVKKHFPQYDDKDYATIIYRAKNKTAYSFEFAKHKISNKVTKVILFGKNREETFLGYVFFNENNKEKVSLQKIFRGTDDKFYIITEDGLINVSKDIVTIDNNISDGYIGYINPQLILKYFNPKKGKKLPEDSFNNIKVENKLTINIDNIFKLNDIEVDIVNNALYQLGYTK